MKMRMIVDSMKNFPCIFMICLAIMGFVSAGVNNINIVVGICLLIIMEVVFAHNLPFLILTNHYIEAKTVKHIFMDRVGNNEYMKYKANRDQMIPNWTAVCTDGTRVRMVYHGKQLPINVGERILIMKSFGKLYGFRDR